jgi:hypothetical protein
LSVAASILEFMDNSSLTRVGHPVVAALDAVSEVLDETGGADVWSLSDVDLQATIVACEVVAARVRRRRGGSGQPAPRRVAESIPGDAIIAHHRRRKEARAQGSAQSRGNDHLE